MEKFDKETYEIVKRLQNARLSLLYKQPFYALLLMHMKFALDFACETAYTDGERIAFNRDFLKDLDDRELEFVLMHEVLHAALGHPFRKQSDYDLECYDKACDIVVNSNILYSFNMDVKSITFKKFGTVPHLTPSREEGYLFNVEQVYGQLMAANGKQSKNNRNNNNTNQEDCGGASFGGDDGDSQSKSDNKEKQSEDENEQGIPCEKNDEESLDNGSGAGGQVGEDDSKSSDNSSADSNGSGEGDTANCGSGNSPADGKKGKKSKASTSGQGGVSGGEVSEEDLQNMISSLLAGRATHGKIDPDAELKDNTDQNSGKNGVLDDHSFWNGDEENNIEKNTWLNRMIETTEMIEASDRFSSSSGGTGRGVSPAAAQRLLSEIRNATLDWRTILNDFVQEEINDYSFSPPDKRMDDCPFFLPDFNETDQSVKDILFMIDTSGSMSEKDITDCYSEIYGAIQQFGGKLQGKLGFFDAVVVDPIEFTDEEEFKIIRPIGGGGTSFDIIFEYVQNKMRDEPPVSIIILTDGYAPIPDEAAAMGIPVLWVINNKNITPGWGKIARILKENNNAPF